jgi:poly(A) polymerase
MSETTTEIRPDSGAEMAERLARAFRDAGEELYLVGGALRDRLLGEQVDELDFATSAHPPRTIEILESLDLGRPYRVGEKFGTIGVATTERRIEITTYRSNEVYRPGSRKPEVHFGATLLDDVSRRDFTINAMARDPLSGTILDPLGGETDLAAGVIRAVGDPAARFREDPLRLLRGIRFAARLGFDIEPLTWQAMTETAPELRSISRERIRDEYSRMLQGSEPVRALTLLRNSRLVEYSVPQLLILTQMPDHGPRHPLSLWDHTMNVVGAVPPELSVRWAALLHDIGKPSTRTHEPSGRPRFFHHEEVGAAIARDILTGLRYSSSVVDAVTLLVSTHMQLHTYTPEWTEGAVRRLMLRLGPQTREAIQLARADASGHSLNGNSRSAPRFDELEARIVHSENEEQVIQLKSPLTGEDLMERYHRPPGPWIREIKTVLEEAVLDGELQPGDRDTAYRIADQLVARHAG